MMMMNKTNTYTLFDPSNTRHVHTIRFSIHSVLSPLTTNDRTMKPKYHRPNPQSNGLLCFTLCLGLVTLLLLTNGSLQSAHAFQSLHLGGKSFLPRRQASFPRNRDVKPLHMFGRNKGQEENGDVSDFAKKVQKKGFSIPFFGPPTEEKELQQSESSAKTAVATMDKPKMLEKEDVSNDPVSLRAKAERTRLEAERMDAELTLSKIDKLEMKLIKAKNKGDSIEDLQRQLDALQAKLRGDPPPTAPASSPSTNVGTTSVVETKQSEPSTATENAPNTIFNDQEVVEAARKLTMTDSKSVATEEDLRFLPSFVVKILTAFVGMEAPKDVQDLNRTEFLRRWNMVKQLDYSFVSNYTTPTFTQSEIDRTKQQIKDNDPDITISDVMVEKAGGNATQLAIYVLEYNYFLGNGGQKVIDMPLQDIAPEFFQDLLNQTSGDALYATYYPKCIFKEDGEPTSSQVDALARTVLPPAKFSSSSKPQKVPGGYIIAGSHRYENGDNLIEAIDRELAKTSLSDKMTVLYAESLGKPADATEMLSESLRSLEQFDLDFDEADLESEPVLYITGPDIVRERNRLGLTVTSILGIATSWYLSIYPFLLNDGIGKRVDQELELLEANLQPDLTWLTDLSFPLFLTFVALQLVHEAGHRLVAASYGVKLTVPTFVPSLITGITSSVTTFKTLPKNKEAMFDISAAGPLAGISASAVALAIGCKLTLVADPSTLPALPLDILRQSTLGGGIIDSIIKGSLYVPEGAPTSGIMISLHPVAIAGYISLVVNALSLLPIGSKCLGDM
jgi:hypothetical protein